MTTFAEDLTEIASHLEAAAGEAAKRRGLRADQGRDLPPETRAQLERCQLALAAILAPVVPATARSTAELRAEIDERMAYLAGPPVGGLAGVVLAAYDDEAGAGVGNRPPAAALDGNRPGQAPPAIEPYGDTAVGLGSGRPAGARPSDD